MGLDMYLVKHVFIGGNYEHREARGGVDITLGPVDNQRHIVIPATEVETIVTPVGYWRKANAIHAWFVRNCQDGEDDCRDAYVANDQLQELLDVVNKILASLKLVDGYVHNGDTLDETGFKANYEPGKVVLDATLAEELLPTQSGFFFGGTDYDEYYIEDLKDTKQILEKALADETPGASFYYHSSW